MTLSSQNHRLDLLTMVATLFPVPLSQLSMYGCESGDMLDRPIQNTSLETGYCIPYQSVHYNKISLVMVRETEVSFQ